MKIDEKNGPTGCEHLMLERLVYFTGRHMAARDFRDADAHHRTLRQLHNRVLHGWGIASGLEVAMHGDAESCLTVQCGIALDCCGREIVVPKKVTQRIPWEDLPREDGCAEPHKDYVLVLCLGLREEYTEKVPVLYSEEACASVSYEDGRIRAGYEIAWKVVKESDLDKYGWRSEHACAPDDAHAPCGEREAGDCLGPECPRGCCVPLAVLRADREPQLDTVHRRFVGRAPEALTHICHISWPHGGVVRESEFERLTVRFDRALEDPDHRRPAGPTGINERTFAVQYGQQHEDLDFVLYETVPYLREDRKTAVFDVREPGNYVGKTIHVTLRCDFLIDCHGNPVDGNHLRGRLPSGDGVMGGTFESWFRLLSDSECDRLAQAAAANGAAS